MEAGLAERRAFTLVLGEVMAHVCIYSGQCWHGFSKPVRAMICLAKLGQGKVSFGMADRNIIQHDSHTKSNQRMADFRNFFFEDRTQSIFGLLALTFTMDSNIPLHLQRLMAIVIRELQNIVGLEVTKTYSGFLSWTIKSTVFDIMNSPWWFTADVPLSAVRTDVVLSW